MQWSKLKSKVESNFCEELKGRVALFSTWYKTGGSPSRGRGSIVLDNVEVFEANTDKWIANNRNDENDQIIERYIFHKQLQEYLTLSIDEAIRSEIPLIKGLAMIDKRLGKRRLLQIKNINNDFVKTLYLERCRIERIIVEI
jgi:hypothetical protein